MNSNLPFDSAGVYYSSEKTDSRPPWIKPPAPFITIARESCSGGSALAQLLAERLNLGAAPEEPWSIFGGDIVNQMLQTNHLPDDLARFLPEDKVPEVNATIGEIVGLHPSLWDLRQKTKETMRRLAMDGRVILVGRGANFATAGLGGVHVRLVAPAGYRAKFYAQRFGTSEADALVHNAKCDAARRRFVSAHYNAAVDDAAAYDLVLNTAQVPLPEAAELILTHLHSRQHLAA